MDRSRKASSPSWSALPTDLLSKIAETLHPRIDDLLRFRSVCNPWRSSVPLPSKTPPSIKLPFPICPNPHLNPDRRGYFLLYESTIYGLQPLADVSQTGTKTWFIKVQASTKSGEIILRHPLSSSHWTKSDTHLPEDLRLPKVLNLLGYKVVEISKDHEVEFVDETDIPIAGYDELKSTRIFQVAINSSSLDKVDDRFVIMALLSDGKLVVWRMGDAAWINIDDNRERSRYQYINRKRSRYQYIVFHNGRFLAVSSDGLTLIVDPISLNISSFVKECLPGKCSVKSSGNLFLVSMAYGREIDYDHYDYPGNHGYVRPVKRYFMLKIYKYNEEKSRWVKVEGLKDQSFFTGRLNSFSLSSKDFAGCEGNSVYAADLSFSGFDGYRLGLNAAIYVLEHQIDRPLSEFTFWPPPAWLERKPLAL